MVVHAVHSRPHLRAFWTAERIRQAKPLSLVAGRTQGQSGPITLQAAPEGTDTGDSTVYPNSANGLVLFQYGSSSYQCSGSVINTVAGDIVLTAGHCVIAPGSGTQATNIAFVPGYRDPNTPFGIWPATSFATTSEWQSTAGTGNPDDADESGDMAMLTIANRSSDGATLKNVVGAVGIAFNQPQNQTYMEYGYPAASPYDGSRLYEFTTPWATDDTSFSPATMGISSDFTPGSSGGPWLVGNAPLAESINTYRYTSGPLTPYMFGPYFGSIGQQLFMSVGGSPAGSTATGTIYPNPSATSAPSAAPSNRFQIEFVSRNRRRGIAVLHVKVPGPGTLKLSGKGLRTVIKSSDGAGILRLAVRVGGGARQRLSNAGTVRVGVTIAYTPTGGSANTKTRGVTLVRRG